MYNGGGIRDRKVRHFKGIEVERKNRMLGVIIFLSSFGQVEIVFEALPALWA